jgi:murein DD-endopeptidase MepM/ murein hydrolase activator NlpD
MDFSKRLISIFLVTILMSTNILRVYAQDELILATGSANSLYQKTVSEDSFELSEASQSSSTIDYESKVILADISEASESGAIPDDSLATPTPISSATLFQKPIIRNLAKKTYRGGEKIDVIVENALISPVEIKVENSHGEKISLPVEVGAFKDAFVFALVPPASFPPGRYRIAVTDKKGNESIQDFSWGVLAINPDQSKYLVGETASLSFAVLDNTGDIVCDASLELAITAPDGAVISLTTGNGGIRTTGMCGKKEVTTVPDYEANLELSEKGTYQLELKAETANGIETITDIITVYDSLPFRIKRNAPTRIYPPNFYPVTIRVTASIDFHGIITEKVPESFTIRPLANTLDYQSVLVKTDKPVPTEYIDLKLPFSGVHPVTLGFGSELLEPKQKELYHAFGLLGHDGIDFDLPDGTPVFAADRGTVVLAEESSYGLTVVIQHSWGKTYYGHLEETLVQVGDKVEKGGNIGLSGHSGIATDPHLHFGLKLNDADVNNGYYGKIDPLPYLTGIAAQSGQSTKEITWEVDLKAGETVTLGYEFQAPYLSPWMFLLGPLELANVTPDVVTNRQTEISSKSAAFVLGAEIAEDNRNMETVYSEDRFWQIASDAVTRVQTPVTNGGKAVSTLAATITAATANNLIIVVCSSSLAETLGVSTSGFSQAINESGTAPAQAIFYKVATGGETTVTCTYGTGTGNRAGIQIFEYSGLQTSSVLDLAGGASTGTGTSPATPAISTGNANDFLIGSVTTIANTAISAYSNSFTLEVSATDGQTPASGRITFSSGSLSVGTTGSYSTTATAGASGNWRGQIAAFKQLVTTPTTDQQLRHGNWFNGGVRQSFTF